MVDWIRCKLTNVAAALSQEAPNNFESVMMRLRPPMNAHLCTREADRGLRCRTRIQ